MHATPHQGVTTPALHFKAARKLTTTPETLNPNPEALNPKRYTLIFPKITRTEAGNSLQQRAVAEPPPSAESKLTEAERVA